MRYVRIFSFPAALGTHFLISLAKGALSALWRAALSRAFSTSLTRHFMALLQLLLTPESIHRISDSGQHTSPFHLHQMPDTALRLPQTSNGGEQTARRPNVDEDGKSMSSNMKDLSLQQGKSAISNKRAATEPAQGQSPGKLPASTGDSVDRGPPHHPPRPALHYDAARDQGPPDPQPRVSAAPRRERHSDIWSSTPAVQTGGGIIARDRLPSTFQSSLEKNNSHLTSPEASPTFNTPGDTESPMLLQPETRPISQEQLVNEVKGIYAGLVMVEKKCVEVNLPPALVLCTAYRYFLRRLTNNRAPLLTSYRMNSGKL
jgi:hypothetical protein